MSQFAVKGQLKGFYWWFSILSREAMSYTSSETQGQIVGARERLQGVGTNNMDFF